MVRILVVEDDKGTRRLMEDVLSDSGYEPISARDGLEALEILEHRHVDLIILDVMMPHMDGYTLTRQLREADYTLPILMVTAKSSQADKKQGLRLGVDDYMTKPVDEEEMLLRIAALLRRSKIAAERRLTVGETELVADSLSVARNGQTVELPQKEFQLLYKLLSYNNKIFTRRQLMDEIWDLDSKSDEHTVNVHINRLRERFRDNPDFEIVTVRGLGYKAVKLG
ncbi:MAG: response regulator transcription factor [Oscillospiraceae bacterium]